MAEEIDRMLAGWQSRGQVDFVAESYGLAARIASRCFYGQEPGLIGSLAETLRDFAHAQMNPLSGIRLKIPGTPYWHLARLAPQIRRILGEELRRKEALGFPGNDVLSMMMRAQHDTKVSLTEDEVLGNALGLYLAGHDVPANGLIFLVALLATHPESAARLMDEIDREIGDGQITYEQVFRLPELGRVWQEMLRVLSPALLIFRQAKVDTTLGDCEIGRGTEVLLSPYMTNTDPATFENPHHFTPERWTKIKPSNYEFLPFGFGPRRCLGASFAEIQLKLAITKIFQKFRLVPVPGAKMDFKYTIAIQPKGQCFFEVKPQDRNFAQDRRPIAGDFKRFVASAP
jgi:cytochrome P450